jgi:hypothetical protein
MMNHMTRSKLFKMIEVGTDAVLEFISGSDPATNAHSSYENWNDRDVLAHINGWLAFSVNTLLSIKTGSPEKNGPAGEPDLAVINREFFERGREKEIEEIESEFIRAMGEYYRAISYYSASDLASKEFDTGFNTELWRYMLLDTVVHPVQHILYQHLKRDEYEKIVNLLAAAKDIFETYAENASAYRLSAFCERFGAYRPKLNSLEERYGSSDVVKTFVRVNGAR